jgi:predicted nuclease of predicted toxin-antitoxin system
MSERFLANENFPGVMVRLLRDQGHDVLYAAETLVAAADHLILETALSQDRVILTFDRDFGELVFRHRRPPARGIVLFRLGALSPDALLAFLQNFFTSEPTLRSYFTVASPGHFRQVPLGEPRELPSEPELS